MNQLCIADEEEQEGINLKLYSRKGIHLSPFAIITIVVGLFD